MDQHFLPLDIPLELVQKFMVHYTALPCSTKLKTTGADCLTASDLIQEYFKSLLTSCGTMSVRFGSFVL